MKYQKDLPEVRAIFNEETRLIGPLARFDCAIIFNKDGVHFMGKSPYEINSSPEQFEAAFAENPSLGRWFDAVLWMSDTEDDGPYIPKDEKDQKQK